MNMEYFFRAVQDPNFFMPSWMKISVTVGLIVVMLLSLFIKNKERAIKIGLCLSLCQQFILYSWYIGTGYHLATEGLPLFHCRICMLGLAFAYFAKKEKLVNYFAILGLICGSMACIVVDLDHFVFPHWTNFSYVVGHYLLVFNAFMLVRERSKIQVKYIIIITLIMNLFILVADLSLKANYGFLMKLPSSLSFVPLTGVSVGVFISVLMILVLAIFNKVLPYNKLLLEDEEEYIRA